MAGVGELAARDDQLERVGVHRVVVEQRLVDDLLAQRQHDVAEVARFLVRGERGDARGAGLRRAARRRSPSSSCSARASSARARARWPAR